MKMKSATQQFHYWQDSGIKLLRQVPHYNNDNLTFVASAKLWLSTQTPATQTLSTETNPFIEPDPYLISKSDPSATYVEDRFE